DAMASFARRARSISRGACAWLARMPTVGRFALATLTAWTALTASRAAWAAPFDVRGEDWEGLSQFVHGAEVEVGSAGVVVGTTLDLHGLEPADAGVVVHPTRGAHVGEGSACL